MNATGKLILLAVGTGFRRATEIDDLLREELSELAAEGYLEVRTAGEDYEIETTERGEEALHDLRAAGETVDR